MSVILPFNNGRAVWRPNPQKSGSFLPRGAHYYSHEGMGMRLNPSGWTSTDPLWVARMFVGFNIDQTPTYSMEYLTTRVRQIRESQLAGTIMKKTDQPIHALPDSSFIYQRGIYTSVNKGYVVEEQSAQVVFINFNPDIESPKNFHGNILALADILREEMKQDEIIVEFQYGGVPKQTVGISAEGKEISEIKLPEIS